MNIIPSPSPESASHRLDAYFLRVAQASQVLEITLLSDLTDLQGKVLIPRSSPLNEFTARRFFNCAIQQNLSNVFWSDHTLQWEDIQKDLLAVLSGDEFLSRINEQVSLNLLIEPVMKELRAASSPEYLDVSNQQSNNQSLALRANSKIDFDFRFRLTILKHSCYETYLRTLLCTWLCVLLVKEMHLTEQDLRAIFIASLAHDLGMLHVSNEILGSDESISAQEWLELQQHVPASAAIVRKIFNQSDAIVLAIEEHHERCDGTGYPLGKVESELSLLGKILALSDSLIAIFRNRFDSDRHSWRDVIPVIQMNAQAYFFRHGELLGNLWRRAEVPTQRLVNVDEVENFVHQLQFQHNRTLAWFNCLTKRILALGFTHGDRKLHAMQNVALHLATSTKGVGIFSEEFMMRLKQLNALEYQAHSKEIQEAYVKLQEVISHLQKLTRMLKIFLDDHSVKDKKMQQELKLVLDEIKAILVGELI